MMCWNYKCWNKVVNGNSVLCPEHLAEWAYERDRKYVSYADEPYEDIKRNLELSNNGLIYQPPQ